MGIICDKPIERQRDEKHREEQRLKSRKRVAERMLENREDGLNTKLSEAEPENKAWIICYRRRYRVSCGDTSYYEPNMFTIQERGSETNDENGFQSWVRFG